MPYFPGTISPISSFQDYVSIDAAANVNSITAEINAIESVLGIDVGSTTNTVASQLSSLVSGKSPIGHTHANLTETTVALGGQTSGAYLLIAGDTIQAENAGALATLDLQPNGGDVAIGNGTSLVTVYGGINVQGGSVVGTDVQGNNLLATAQVAGQIGYFQDLSVIINANINTAQVQILSLGTPGTIGSDTLRFANADQIGSYPVANAFSMPGLSAVTLWGNNDENDKQYTRKAVNGQLWVHKDTSTPSSDPGTDNGWVQSPIVSGRTNEQTSSIALVGLIAEQGNINSGQGIAYQMTVMNSEPNKGFMFMTSTFNTFAPVTASGFVTASSSRYKEGIEDMSKGALSRLTHLRPVSYVPKVTNGHQIAVAPDGTILDGNTEDGRAAVERQNRDMTAGERKHSELKRHGLIAEEVARVIPEVITYDKSGRPDAINYGDLVPTLIQAIKELRDEVIELRRKVL